MPGEQLLHMCKNICTRAFWEISPDNCRRTNFSRTFPKCFDFDVDYPVCLRQGLIEQVMLHDAEEHVPGGFQVQWGSSFIEMELPADAENDICKVVIQSTLNGVNTRKTIGTRFVIAADGGKSDVRKWAGRHGVKLMGEVLPYTWCVTDVVGLKSDFPDLERLS